jgi:hypothetical protein
MNESLQAGRVLDILVGLVCGVIGLGLLSLATIIGSFGIKKGVTTQPIFLFSLPIMAGLGAFFGLISYRLVLNRGAKLGGGLLSPTGWSVAGTIFAALAIILAIAAIWQGKWDMLPASLFAVIFAKWCFSTAKTQSGKILPNSSTV